MSLDSCGVEYYIFLKIYENIWNTGKNVQRKLDSFIVYAIYDGGSVCKPLIIYPEEMSKLF